MLKSAEEVTRCGKREFRWGQRTYVMGVINVTPYSFSGDGIGDNVDLAVERSLQMEAEGADVIDVGGESTRRYNNKAGAVPISTDEELRRVIPVVQRLSQVLSVPISVDTYKAPVAQRSLDAGASMLNDVWGVRTDSGMLKVVADAKVPLVIMHNQIGSQYNDLIQDMINSLRSAVEGAMEKGVLRENIIIDPGIGFGKVMGQSLEIERRLDEFRILRQPILVGLSRKSHIGLVLGGLPVEERLEGTAAAVALTIAKGADMIRVHDVKEMVRVALMSDAIVRGWRPAGG